jgi:probable HAF family extracellular repeat protein
VQLDPKSHRTLLTATFLVLMLGLVALPASAATYQEISAPNSDQTWASGINNLGQVVGYYEIPNTNIIEGFLLSGGVYTSIIFNGEPNTFATAINDSGLIAGFVQTQDIGTPYFGFTYQNGFKSMIKFPTAKSTQAFGINNAGQVVGAYVDLKNVSHGFLFSAGTYKSIDIANAKSTIAVGINKAGDISGTYVDQSSQEHGFLLHKNGTLTVINYHGATNGTVVGGINDHDQLAGYFTPPTIDQSTGFEYNAGTFTTILYPTAVSTQPFGINNSQLVVGAWVTQQGNAEGFMETP